MSTICVIGAQRGDEGKVLFAEIDELPAPARDFALAIETECGVPVELVSVGPSREQVIRRARG